MLTDRERTPLLVASTKLEKERKNQMTTKELIARLPQNVMDRINGMKKILKTTYPGERKYDEARNMINGYTKGLMDAGMITDRERSILYVYATL